jgi:inhibitor of KinA
MQIKPMSESSYLLYDLEHEPYLLANSIEIAGITGVREIVTSVDTIALFVDPDRFDPDSIPQIRVFEDLKGRSWRVPILFDGSDLKEICNHVKKEPEIVAAMFCACEFTVVSIGFLPGFPYMKGISSEFHGLNRRAIPRIHVPKGSVGIAAGQTGIYPAESPGGWNLIGTTPLRIADRNSRFFPLNPGDTIQFYEVDSDQFKKLSNVRIGDQEYRG